MVMLLEMTVGKVFWLLALFAATTFANNLTCTDLSWENNAVTLRNAGNVRNELCLFAYYNIYIILQHILVLSSMRLDCFGDDKRFEYTNNSVLLNPVSNLTSQLTISFSYDITEMFRGKTWSYQVTHGCIIARQHFAQLVSYINAISSLS